VPDMSCGVRWITFARVVAMMTDDPHHMFDQKAETPSAKPETKL